MAKNKPKKAKKPKIAKGDPKGDDGKMKRSMYEKELQKNFATCRNG